MNNINIVLVDDEQDSLTVTQILIKKYHPNVTILATFTNSLLALEYLRTATNVHIVLLDIEMPALNGFDLLEQLNTISFKVIFVTAYDRYMLKAIKSAVFDYLLKPIDRHELAQAFKRFNELQIAEEPQPMLIANNENSKIILPVGQEYQFINISEIVRCESNNNYTTILLKNKHKILISKTLKYIEQNLPNTLFIRVHSKHLININCIAKFVKSEGGFLVLDNEEIIPVSREKKEGTLQALGIK
jgi:two-component system, LytTR family, response regulator